jgi:hypothetical protein
MAPNLLVRIEFWGIMGLLSQEKIVLGLFSQPLFDLFRMMNGSSVPNDEEFPPGGSAQVLQILNNSRTVEGRIPDQVK